MKTLLINPPSPYLSNDAAYPPMGLMYVAAAIERAGDSAEILDLAGTENWPAELDQSRYDGFDLVGITCVTPNIEMVREIINYTPPEIPVMVGGAHPTHLPLETIAYTGCDFVIRGEAEIIIPEVLKNFRHSNKTVYGMEPVTVSDIPKPARHLVDLHRYAPGGDIATPVYTSRGCNFGCRFCSKLAGITYREIPLKQIVDEVCECRDAYGFRKIVFGDDNIAMNPKRLTELLTMLKPLDISFRLNQDARHNKQERFDLAWESGCTDISFGIESGSQRMLNAMNKQITVSRNAEAIRMTQNAGMEAKAYFMVNYPEETEESVKETLRFAEDTRPDKWMVSSFAPLPGSYAYTHAKELGILSMSNNWSDYYLVGKDGQFKPCFTTKYLTYEKQVELHDMMVNGLKEILV